MRVVLDTNILIAAGYAQASASRQIVQACLDGELELALSGPLEREYRFILERALRGSDFHDSLERVIQGAVRVEIDEGQHWVPGDPDDAKVLATAVAAGARVLVSNDQHLLVMDPYHELRILRPSQFLDFRSC